MHPNGPAVAAAEVAILIDGEAQPLYELSDGEFFVLAAPGTPYQIQVTIESSGDHEFVVLDGEMEDERASTWSDLRNVPCGTICPGNGTYILEKTGDVRSSRPLVFGTPSFFRCLLFGRYWASEVPDSLDSFMRGYRLGGLTIQYGPVLPTS